MGCCGGDREKAVSVEQRWDYITLTDFKSTSCLTPFSYIWLWILAFIGIAVYVADTFTAVNLLAFNRWSSQIQPRIPFEVSKWIFSVCIILSVVLAVYEWQRAIRVIRRGSVAESYLDDLAVVLQSQGIWQGSGWRRFLVFAELTKHRKGVDYVALFVYFQFRGALRIILAEGPRQAVNAITLYSVMQADLVPVGDHSSKQRNNFDQFWFNVEILAMQNRMQTVILFTMLFTLTIWVISALLLITAIVLYLLFLWHYIPSSDGSLRAYCRRKVDRRLESIVGKKVKKALEKEQAKMRAAERKALKEGKPVLHSQPTLPSVDEKAPVPGLTRTDSAMTSMTSLSDTPSRTTTLTSTSARPQGLPGINENPNQRPGMPQRTNTPGSMYSNASYSSNAPLLDNADGVGYSDPPVPRVPGAYGNQPPMNRSMSSSTMGSSMMESPINRPSTANSQRFPMGPPGNYPQNRNGPPGAYPPGRAYPPIRPGTAGSYRSQGQPPQGISPVSPYDQRQPMLPPAGSMGPGSYEMSPVSPITPARPAAAQMPVPRNGGPRGESMYDIDDYFSERQGPAPEMPAPLNWQRTNGPAPYPHNTGRAPSPQGSEMSAYSAATAPPPTRNFSAPMPQGPPPPSRGPQMRSATAPYPGPADARSPQGRFPGNAPSPLGPGPNGAMGMPPRSATAPLRGPGPAGTPPMSGGLRSQSARPWEGGPPGGAF